MMKRSIYILGILVVLFVSCKEQNSGNSAGNSGYRVDYATGFTVNKQDSYTEVKIRDPWDTTKYLQHYILVDREKPVPENIPRGNLIKVPLEKLVVCSSVHCSFLEMLESANTIKGVCESRYIHVSDIQEKVKSGEIIDIGESFAPDIEKLIELSPEAIVTSPIDNGPYGRVEKTGIPQLKCIDYMEPTPLGRAEWIRFLGLFVRKEALADSVFKGIEKAYLETKALVKEVEKRPSVITELKTGSMWYIPGGQSYVANMFRDAGADYAWYEDTHTGSLGLSFESVYEKGGEADYWLIKYNKPVEIGYGDLKKEYDPYTRFNAYKSRRIYVCNTGKVPYYEEIPIRPDYLLKDLIKIFHPEVLPNDTLRYYKPMK